MGRRYGRSNRYANRGHQKNAAGYTLKSISYLTGLARKALYGLNSNSTGGVVEDDYEVNLTSDAFDSVRSYMLEMCGNEGQQAIIEDATIDGTLIIYHDFNPEHADQPDEPALAYIEIDASHPEAVEEILSAGIDYFYEYAREHNR